jgi:Ca-activated chloride channel homolog
VTRRFDARHLMRRKLPTAAVAMLAILSLPVVTPFGRSLARQAQTQDASTFYEQGVKLIKAGELEEAIKALKQAIKLKPDYVDAYFRLGETYGQMDDFKKAADAYKQIVKYTPTSVVAYTKLGGAYYEAGERKKAIDAYTEALRLDPKAAEVHYKLGVVYVQENKEQPAVAEYNILQTLNPKLAQDLYNLIYKPMVGLVGDGTVHLNVVATDAQGAPVSGLTKDDFQVVEDGVTQPFALSVNRDSPRGIAVAIDTSGSLRAIFPLIIDSAKAIVAKTAPADETFLVRFISSNKIEKLQEFTSDKQALAKAIDGLYIEAGQSAVVDATYISAESLAGYRFPDRSVHRVLLLLTDGEDRASFYSVDQLVKLLRRIDVQIFPISLSIAEGSQKLNQDQPKQSIELLTRLASESGGKAFFPTSIPEVQTAINQVFNLMSGEYVLEYKPSKPIEAGVYRSVAVTIVPKPNRENWRLLVRRGYLFSPK